MKRIILRGGALLELDQVRHVLAVVKYRTFLEASFQLNRSQSSLSKSIRRLEEELGISIFERTTRRVELTPAGRDFVAYAEQMMVCYEGMLHAMEQHRSNGKRSLRVGSIYFGLHNRLPLWWPIFPSSTPAWRSRPGIHHHAAPSGSP